MRITGPFCSMWQTKYVLVTTLLTLFCLGTALTVVYSKHQSRLLHANLQKLDFEIAELNAEWSRLLLERSTWTSNARIERIARERLKMVIPDNIDMIEHENNKT